MSHTYDVVIVGAGIMGCCSAFELAQRGLTVAVLEKDTLGSGATGRSSAIIRQHYSNQLTARMALYSLRVFQEFEERIGDECGFRAVGFLALASPDNVAGLRANIELQQGVGIRTEFVTPEIVRELMPGLETRDVSAAAYESESGYADPHLTVSAYAAAARRLGVEILQDTEVVDVQLTGERVVGVGTTRGDFAAPAIVNCAGPWGARVAAMAGVSVPITSNRVQVAVFRRPPQLGAEHPVIVDFVGGTYLRPETGDLTLVGSIDPAEATAVVDPDRYPEHVDPDFVAAVGERVLHRYPPMEESESTGGYAGLYAITPDWHPIVDEMPPDSGHFVCSGFSGHGYKLGPAVGVMVADLVTEAPDPTFPHHLFRSGRFAERDEVRGQYEYSIAG